MFDHLTIIDVSEDAIKRIKSGKPLESDKARFTQIKLWLGSSTMTQSIAKKIIRYGVFSEREAKTGRTIKIHDTQDIEDAQSFDSPFGYEDDFQELECAVKYNKQIQAGFPTPSESKILYEKVTEHLTNIFQKESIPVFLNFGINLAHIDNLLAEKFPEINFIGIDRSKLTKAFNETLFPPKRNLELIAGDIFELLSTRDFNGGVFFHMRTCTFLPSGFLQELYSAVRKAGFRYIVGFEPMGISRQTGMPYVFSLDRQESVAYRGHAYIHNYPNYLLENGFSVAHSELIKTGHAHEDYRIVNFVAELD